MTTSLVSSTGCSVEVQNLVVRFGDFVAVNKINFQVSPGEIFGFLGANGAGKTTTIRVLCGLIKPSEGVAEVVGLNVAAHAFEVKKRVGYMSQKFTLYDDLTIEENIHFQARLRRLDQGFYLRRKKELFDFIHLSKSENTMVKELPGGLRQQVSLVVSLLHDPDIVFLDEPTAGVTPVSRARFWNLIRLLAGQGKTVFVTTHYMDEAEQCGRVALMGDGHILALDTPANLKKQAFDNNLYELTPNEGLSNESVHAILIKVLQSSGVLACAPYGRCYHLVLHKGQEVHAGPTAALITPYFQLRRLDPTLEDVFLWFVERGKK